MKRNPHIHPTVHCPGYSTALFDTRLLPAVVTWVMHWLPKTKAQAIAACGHSGLPLGGIIAHLTGLPLMAVRKPGEPVVATTNHRRVSAIMPNGPVYRWVWLDDMFSSGYTLRNSARELWEAGVVRRPYPCAALLYMERYGDRTTIERKRVWKHSWEADFTHAKRKCTFNDKQYMLVFTRGRAEPLVAVDMSTNSGR